MKLDIFFGFLGVLSCSTVFAQAPGGCGAFVIFNNQCVSSCPTGSTQVANTCTCNSPLSPQGTSCVCQTPPNFTFDGRCVTSCPTGSTAAANGVCTCPSPLVIQADSCACPSPNQDFFDGKCLDKCPIDQIRTSVTACSCKDTAKEVVYGVCVPRCSNGYFRDDTGRCVPSCPPGTYYDVFDGSCLPARPYDSREPYPRHQSRHRRPSSSKYHRNKDSNKYRHPSEYTENYH